MVGGGEGSRDLCCLDLRLAAVALLVLQSEEEAFWCLVAIVETIMPQDYYTKNLVASQVSKLSSAGHMTRVSQYHLFRLGHVTWLRTCRLTSVC